MIKRILDDPISYISLTVVILGLLALGTWLYGFWALIGGLGMAAFYILFLGEGSSGVRGGDHGGPDGD